ncbi:hypothetical protein [Actinokineospora xionganensis]|uniref:hypothetical protein n=1 Tax=Actinokineospora xionganensis TaxID=2684470 RepID=UPI001FE6D5A1|nr:hypothetical protein [Actinokineospora xionganensis]
MSPATAGRAAGNIARFGVPEQAEFPHAQPRTADSLVATIATRAGVLPVGTGHTDQRAVEVRDQQPRHR